MSRRPRREFTEEFKLQMVKLYNSGKPVSQIVKEYYLTRSAFMIWIKQYNNSFSFKESDNRTEEEKELIKLRKEINDLKIENEILKKAMAIFTQK